MSEQDRSDLNDRQNGWQANVKVDNRQDGVPAHENDARYNTNWRDDQWRQTAHAGGHPAGQADDAHDWRPNDDSRNEQRNGSEPDRDRGTYGNSRFRDDDFGYPASQDAGVDYGRDETPADARPPGNDKPRGFTADSERDYDDRNPSRQRD